jgi:hypothetical protein
MLLTVLKNIFMINFSIFLFLTIVGSIPNHYYSQIELVDQCIDLSFTSICIQVNKTGCLSMVRPNKFAELQIQA